MIYDVVIVGAGPCGLAVASRLCEPTPSALFTDAEHARYWQHFSGSSYTLEHEAKRLRGSKKTIDTKQIVSGEIHPHSIVVLDAESDSWMSLWRSRFQALKISHLRSPLFFHCDPRDRDGLLGFAHAEGRSKELQEITNVVGKEVSKHQTKKRRKAGCQCPSSARHLHIDGRDQIDYYTPSSDLFDDYCEEVVSRYNLTSLIHRARVESISYDDAGIATEDSDLFTLTTTAGQTYFARTVVLAIGAGSTPSIPSQYKKLSHPPYHPGSLSHIFSPSHSISNSIVPPEILTQPSPQIAIIGGGLTSLQATTLLLSQNSCLTVNLICRSKLKIKHFDVDLHWVSKLRNHAMSAFWSADTDQERFEMLKDARGGGSIPPSWSKILKRLVEKGRVKVWECFVIDVEKTSWCDDSKTWDLKLKGTASPSTSEGLVVSLPRTHHLLFTTTHPPNITTTPFLTGLQAAHPISNINGLPVLSDSLQWSDEVPLFVTGALAGLRLGPGAGNLAGARLGAERVAWGIEALLGGRNGGFGGEKGDVMGEDSAYGSGGDEDGSRRSGDDGREVGDFTGGFRNQFEVLSV